MSLIPAHVHRFSNGVEGVLADDLHLVAGDVRNLASGARVIVVNGTAWPILCGEPVQIPGDTIAVEPCAYRLFGGEYVCASCSAERSTWRAETEAIAARLVNA